MNEQVSSKKVLSPRNRLWDYLQEQHELVLLESELNEIIDLAVAADEPSAEPDQPAVIQLVAVKNGRACVIGIPAHYSKLPEDHPWQHNCDANGCTSVEHMLWRGPVQDESTAQPPGDDRTITALCDRIERIYNIAMDTSHAAEDRVRQIQEWSGGFMRPPSTKEPTLVQSVCDRAAHLADVVAEAVPPGHFWRGVPESNRHQCRNCGWHYDKHLHTDEASRCPVETSTSLTSAAEESLRERSDLMHKPAEH